MKWTFWRIPFCRVVDHQERCIPGVQNGSTSILCQYPANRPSIWSIPYRDDLRQCQRHKTRLLYDKIGHLSHETCRTKTSKRRSWSEYLRLTEVQARAGWWMRTMNFEQCTKCDLEVVERHGNIFCCVTLQGQMPAVKWLFHARNSWLNVMFLAGQIVRVPDVEKLLGNLINRVGLPPSNRNWMVGTVLD